MTTLNWQELLEQISKQVLKEDDFQDAAFISAMQRAVGWVGNAGATEAELAQVEVRLHCILPPSYRSFLAVSNGFGPISPFIYNLSSAAEVNWLRIKEPELVEMWEEDPMPIDSPALVNEHYLRYDDQQNSGILKPTHLRQCLMISDWGDAGFLALNPAQQQEGEWEAWHFANWYPGAHRYRSFAELMRISYQDYLELRQE